MTDRDEWLADRLTGIGASDVAAALHNVYGGATKVVGVRIGLPNPDPINPDDADRGHRWETAIADGVLAHYGLYVHGEQMHLKHKGNPRWMCTPDGLLSPHAEATFDDLVAGLEIKTRQPGARWRWDYWTTQAAFGCLVSGLPRWLVAVATIVTDFDVATGALAERVDDVRYRWVEPDPFQLDELGRVADDLWSWVERGELPPAGDAEALGWVKAANVEAGQVCPDCEGDGKHRGGGRRKHCARCDGTGVANIDRPAEIDDLADDIERREELQAAAALAADEADLIEARIRERLGSTMETTTADGVWRVRCGLPVRRFTDDSEAEALAKYPDLTVIRFDRERFKADHPDEYDAMKRTTTDRRLTIRQMKEPRP